MPVPIIVDTGAIIGALSEQDQWHARAASLFQSLPKPFITCEAVITEASFQMRKLNGLRPLLDLFPIGAIKIDFLLGEEIERVDEFLHRYENVPMSLADACIVRMSELFDAPVFTFDSDFRIYRRNRRGIIPLIGIDN